MFKNFSSAEDCSYVIITELQVFTKGDLRTDEVEIIVNSIICIRSVRMDAAVLRAPEEYPLRFFTRRHISNCVKTN